MFSNKPNYLKLRTNLRLCINRLKLLEKKKTELALKARREIADYIAAGKEDRARIRVEHIVREDYLVEAMEIVEMLCDLLLARFGIIEKMQELDAGIEEAVATIIWVAPRLSADVQELQEVANQLTLKYGKEYAHMCRSNAFNDDVINAKVIHKMNIAAPPKILIENYMMEIAKSFKVAFEPDPVIMMGEPPAVSNLINLGIDSEFSSGGGGGSGVHSGGTTNGPRDVLRDGSKGSGDPKRNDGGNGGAGGTLSAAEQKRREAEGGARHPNDGRRLPSPPRGGSTTGGSGGSVPPGWGVTGGASGALGGTMGTSGGMSGGFNNVNGGLGGSNGGIGSSHGGIGGSNGGIGGSHGGIGGSNGGMSGCTFGPCDSNAGTGTSGSFNGNGGNMNETNGGFPGVHGNIGGPNVITGGSNIGGQAPGNYYGGHNLEGGVAVLPKEGQFPPPRPIIGEMPPVYADDRLPGVGGNPHMPPPLPSRPPNAGQSNTPQARYPLNPAMSMLDDDDNTPSLPPYDSVMNSVNPYSSAHQVTSGGLLPHNTNTARLSPTIPTLPDVPGLPSIPADSVGGAGGGEDVDFDDLTRRFEELKRRK